MAVTSGVGALGFGILSDKIQTPVVVALSLLASSITMYFYSGLDVGATLTHIVMVTAMQSMFRSGAQATMTTMGLDTLPAEQTTLGAGMDTLARNLGNTAGVPLITTYVIHRELSHLTKMMSIQTLDRDGPREAMETMQRAYSQAGQPLDEARVRSQGMLRNQLIQRATIEAYHDSFRLVSIAGLLLVPMVLLSGADAPRRETSVSGGSTEPSANHWKHTKCAQKNMHGIEGCLKDGSENIQATGWRQMVLRFRPSETRHIFALVVFGIGFLFAVVYVINWWITAMNTVSTDEARVTAAYATISSEVSGKIIKFSAEEGDVVRQGDLLVEIDKEEFQSAWMRR